ncbi:MarR family winged helix-turn-helix transcriptional regulator [Roseibium sp. MMSF_3412]|uniref:MarR family winged helix-turn-helix transcriptional regulator n=1 Tax=Roseibium sp. MMSF_3412 TaxID=3046712 RepID=UPI0027402C40|nr:MarR family transcriptional regulator [Roseibium sp. MMSF_3412]
MTTDLVHSREPFEVPKDDKYDIPANLVLDQQLCFAVHAASNRISDLYRPLLAEHGLTYAQYTTLMALAEEDGVSITHLATRLGVAKATMTPLLRKLEEKALITRKMDDESERQKSIRITEAGRELLSQSCHATEIVFATTGLTEKQANDLIALCKKVSTI